MWRFFTSLSFLYIVTGMGVLLFALFQYRDFKAGRVRRWRFPALLTTVALACIAFLWLHFHAPLSLQTYTNADHHFWEHSGYLVKKQLMLGAADTAHNKKAAYNEFWIRPGGNQALLESRYSEEPLYISVGDRYQLISPRFNALGQPLTLAFDNRTVQLELADNDVYRLHIGNSTFEKQQLLRKGIRVWDLFRDDSSFANGAWVNDVRLSEVLQQVYLVRNDLNRKTYGDLVYFLSGRLAGSGVKINIGSQPVTAAQLQIRDTIPSGTMLAWGIAFLDNNRNQFRVLQTADGDWKLLQRYPLAYPLSEDQSVAGESHVVTRFLLGDGSQLDDISPVFRDGFLFPAPDHRVSSRFAPVLLQYQIDAHHRPLGLTARAASRPSVELMQGSDELLLPAADGSFTWLFKLRNSFNWQLGSVNLSAGQWMAIIFGSLFLLLGLLLADAFLRKPHQQNAVAQILAVLTFVFLTTRFFLYWRYKSFPPYEGMDLPSQQQLNSPWNFYIIVLATLVMALVLSLQLWKTLWARLPILPAKIKLSKTTSIEKLPTWKKAIHSLRYFLAGWVAVLMLAGLLAAWSGFDSGICRHIAIFSVLLYFLFLFQSYRHSPLVVRQQDAWWRLQTHRWLDMLVSNPVKVLLSVSLLAFFVFIDIGFAIVFLNFLLFNEAFLCINYAIGGLSSGSRKNASRMGIMGGIYLLIFIANLLFAPWLFRFLLEMPEPFYWLSYALAGCMAALVLGRLAVQPAQQRKRWWSVLVAGGFFLLAFVFLPKEKILEKAASTRYRINVLTQPLDQALTEAYSKGDNHIPVIRAAQNQWFINTFVDQSHNPAAGSAAFHLVQHAPQNKGARYNAQATDLVASRFLVAEHGRGAIFLYVCLLLLPAIVLSSFYQLYPDFTNRINPSYAPVSVGFGVLNYLLVTALMVVLAATGRYIFFGQDLPFASILSKQSVLFPVLLLIFVLLLFRQVQAERFANRRKWVPGVALLGLLFVLLFFVNPPFHRQREFTVPGLANSMESFVETRLQPLLSYFDSSRQTRRLTAAEKDKLFCDSLRRRLSREPGEGENPFFWKEAKQYAYTGFNRHRDQRRLLYLDTRSNDLRLQVNDRYFQVEPPPHLQALWKGDVVGDTTLLNITLRESEKSTEYFQRLDAAVTTPGEMRTEGVRIRWTGESSARQLQLGNTGAGPLHWRTADASGNIAPGQSMALHNGVRLEYGSPNTAVHGWISVQPDAFMENYWVNGSRYYHYPLGERFIWARNFAEAASVDFSRSGRLMDNAIVSLDYEWTDSLTLMLKDLLNNGSLFADGASYGITVADGEGRLLAMADHIRAGGRIDPNDKAAFQEMLLDEEGEMRTSDWRRQLGNINLLRMNPGPGSTLKPIVFSAIASQLPLDWKSFASTGFSEKQKDFGGMRVPEYDFELNNGRVASVSEYIRLSDNYYHANLLLLGSYRKQPLIDILGSRFTTSPGKNGFWPRLEYGGKTLFMHGFSNWPGYDQGQADFGSDSSFTSIGLWRNFAISNDPRRQPPGMFQSAYDSELLGTVARQSGYVLPEWSLFDQKGWDLDHHIPYDLFLHCFRGHVKGSSQVMISPVGMVHALGRLTSQNANYTLSLNPAAANGAFKPFDVSNDISYNAYLELMTSQLFRGMRSVLEQGTAAGLGRRLAQGKPFYYFAKTGTTGDDEKKTKSKLLAMIISADDLSSPNHVFRNNRFIIVYFTSQDGPPVQQEEFQARIIRYLESSQTFQRYMQKGKD